MRVFMKREKMKDFKPTSQTATSYVRVFVSYSTVLKGYRIINPITQKVHESRSVKFNENDA